MVDTSHEQKNIKSLTLDQFPILLDGLSEKRIDRFAKALKEVESGLAAQVIPNPVFKDAKELVGRIVDDAFKRYVNEKYFYAVKYADQPQAVQDLHNSFMIMGLHDCKSAAKKVRGTKVTGATVDAMKRFFDEVEPLVEAFDTLKPLIVKRKVLTDEEREAKERFVPPPSSTGAILAVQKVLQDVTEKQYNSLVGYFERGLGRNVSCYMEADKEERKRLIRDPSLREGVFEAGDDNYGRSDYKLRPNHQEILHKIAVKEAKDIQDAFINKNLKKLCSIVENKGDFDRVEEVGSTVSMSGLEGTLRVYFEDGSQFTANNSVVRSRSVHGKRFHRFPLTFHDVVLPGGERMAKPSEERMNTIFAPEAAPGEPEDGKPAVKRSTGPSMG